MKIIRPIKLGVFTRTIDVGREPASAAPSIAEARYLVVSVMTGFHLGPQVAERLVTEQRLWTLLREHVGVDLGIDEGLPKIRGEVLVHGSAFAPGGAPCSVCQVRVALGSIDKRLAVFGDRRWRVVGMTDPSPFARMPVDWQHAFGGEGFEPNPVGKDLPNVEDPKHLIVSGDDRPPPAGFSSIPANFEPRRRKQGTYDREWLKRRSPSRPLDFDPAFHNLAPEDQQLPRGFFRGDEEVRIENMHPETPVLEGRLPAIAVRVLSRRRGSEIWDDRAADLDTLYLVPSARLGVMIFRGLVPVEDADADDLDCLMVAADDLSRPRPRSHFEEVLSRRLDPKKGFHYSLRDRELLPEGEPSGYDFSEGPIAESEDLRAKNIRRRAELELERGRSELRAQGIDPDQHLPRKLPEPEKAPSQDELPEYLERMGAEAEKMKAEAETKRSEAEQRVREACKEAKVDYDEYVAKAKREGGGPPKRLDAQLEELREQQKLAWTGGVELPAVDAQLADPKLHEKLAQAYDAMLMAYRRCAHHMPGAAALDEPASAKVRAAVEQAHAAGESLAGRDLTGADLRGIDLAGADLTDALLERTNLANAKLRGATLTGAVLTRADLSGADLHGAKLDKANLGEAILTGATLDEASLREVVLCRADLARANLARADLWRADLGEARFDETDLSEADLGEVTLIEGKLARQKLIGVSLRRACLVDCDLTGADLSGAKLERAVLVGCKLDGANLRDVDGERLCVAGKSSLAGADLRGARLPSASILESSLRGADLSEATLDGANFQKSDLSEAKLYRASARGAMFMRASLDRASLVACNLMQARLVGASLLGANFIGSNLFRADLTRTKVSSETRFDDAEMTFAITVGQVKA